MSAATAPVFALNRRDVPPVSRVPPAFDIDARTVRRLSAKPTVPLETETADAGSGGFTDRAAALAYLRSPAWHQKNARRSDLIDKEIDDCLNPAEEKELEGLQREADAVLAIAHPQPPFDSAKLEAIEARLQGGNGNQ